jgi:hypothetical protein
LLAIPGVNVLSRLAEQIVSTSSFAAGEPSGRTPLRDGANKPLPRIAPVYLQNITPSLVLCPSLLGQNLGQNPFCSLAKNG